MLITSRNNDTVRLMRSLVNRKARLETGLHLIEGKRLVFDALRAGAKAEYLLIEEGEWELEARATSLEVPFISVTRSVMNSISDTKTPQGVAAAVKTPDLTPPAVYPGGLAVALDRMQDPGNLGTVLRTADAMGAGCVLLGEGSTDPYSPKALRSAMGSTYHVPVYEGDLTAELKRLAAEGRPLLCGHLKGSEVLPDIGENCVIVIGNEGSGVSEEVASLCTLYRLKMYGRAESLNASVAASLMIYEVTKKLHEV